jgi:hypothetical protein
MTTEEKQDLLIHYIVVRDLYNDWYGIVIDDYKIKGYSKYHSLVKRLGKEKSKMTTKLSRSIGMELDKEFPI